MDIKEAIRTIQKLAPAYFVDGGKSLKLNYMHGDWKELNRQLNGPELEDFVVAAMLVVREYNRLATAIDEAAEKMRSEE